MFKKLYRKYIRRLKALKLSNPELIAMRLSSDRFELPVNSSLAAIYDNLPLKLFLGYIRDTDENSILKGFEFHNSERYFMVYTFVAINPFSDNINPWQIYVKGESESVFDIHYYNQSFSSLTDVFSCFENIKAVKSEYSDSFKNIKISFDNFY